MAKIRDYKVGFTIGKGSDGIAKLATKQGKTFCLKIIPINNTSKLERVKQEIKALERLRNHPKIIQIEESFHYVKDGKKCICIVTELFGSCNLADYLKQKKGKLEEEEAKKIFCQLVEAVEFMHAKKIAHRDLKLENVVIDPFTGLIKVIDFGLAAVCESFEEMETLTEPCGTPYYLSPELGKVNEANSAVYDGRSSDVWSAGVLLCFLISGSFPFDNSEGNLQKLMSSIQVEEFEMPQNCSSELSSLLLEMLQKDPKKRLTLPLLKEHRWLQKSKIRAKLSKSSGRLEDTLRHLEIPKVNCRLAILSF